MVQHSFQPGSRHNPLAANSNITHSRLMDMAAHSSTDLEHVSGWHAFRAGRTASGSHASGRHFS